MKTDPPLSAALERAQELREERKSLRGIAEILEAEGVPLPPGRGKKWNHTAVGRLFRQFEALPPPPTPSTAAGVGTAAVDPQPSAPRAAPAPNPRHVHRLSVKIQGPWIDTDSLLWEFLIHKVWEELGEKTDHTLPLQAGLKGLRLSRPRRERAHLWEALDRLSASRVKLEGQLNNQLLSISTPLISAVLTEDSLSFQFPAALIKLVKNPREYIRLKELFAAKH